MCFPDVAAGQQSSLLSPAEESAMTRRHVLNKLYSLDLITREAGENCNHLSGPSITKGKKVARIMRVAQDDLERQQQLDDPDNTRIRAIRSPTKRFIVCALGIAILVMFYRGVWVT